MSVFVDFQTCLLDHKQSRQQHAINTWKYNFKPYNITVRRWEPSQLYIAAWPYWAFAEQMSVMESHNSILFKQLLCPKSKTFEYICCVGRNADNQRICLSTPVNIDCHIIFKARGSGILNEYRVSVHLLSLTNIQIAGTYDLLLFTKLEIIFKCLVSVPLVVYEDQCH